MTLTNSSHSHVLRLPQGRSWFNQVEEGIAESKINHDLVGCKK